MSVQGSSSDVGGKSESQNRTSFAQLDPPINPALLSALSALSLCYPTQVQKEFIPLALNGKDILARSSTGSGKTLAYAIPILQSILENKFKRRTSTTTALTTLTMAVILVPTRELSAQVTLAISSLCKGLGNENAIEIINLASSDSKRSKRKHAQVDQSYTSNPPDIIVSTPARLLDRLRTTPTDMSGLSFLVLDEADLILSYGHSFDDIKAILSGSGSSGTHSWRFPTFFQSFLMSATMTSEVAELKSLVLRNPEILYVKESINELSNLTQFSIKVPNEQDKFLLIYVIFRLKLIKGKGLVFVNSTDKSYQLKLFLEKFGIRSGVLNSELPFNSRYHAVEEFNKGIFDYLIATDESENNLPIEKKASNPTPAPTDPNLILTQPSVAEETTDNVVTNPKKRKNRDDKSQDKPIDYGVSRGIDFVNVACVINFDLPLSTQSYTHRIGRTARAGRTGIGLSFVLSTARMEPSSNKTNKNLQETCARETEMWKKIEAEQITRGSIPKEYKFDMTQVEGFRYRMEDGLRSVTKAAIREARIKEIKNEILNSTKLKSHFEENPNDLMFLKHDKPLHPTRIQPHMKHVPSYLIPKITNLPIRQQDQPQDSNQGSSNPDPATTQPSLKTSFNKNPNRARQQLNGKSRGGSRGGRGGRGGGGGRGGKKKNPLKSFTST
ncbi:ATP-dependent DNA/RNA helicase [Puccinia graminis f. sp. tritici]|uniref:RNA helicase n=1 Tax=Puccinia graminis f. sp. tritici TaxID=56615 RepID=A0A5B0NW48_PUCGR|nr:ATP-dependent DNA/RNA helicase [Puccinia graminis f. sp. tritici]KAA1115777.1 ATP-dependent DNA/RNA helicase [Puccinia graminis f. sp. tritici]